MNEEWVGAWRWLSEGNLRGRPTVERTRYCFIAVMLGRTGFVDHELSDSEAAALFRTIGGAGGGTLDTRVEDGEVLQVNTNSVGLYPEHATNSVLRATRVDGDLMSQQVLGPKKEILADYRYERISPQGKSSLAGSWDLKHDDWQGVAIFTDTDYAYLLTRNERPLGCNKESADSDLAELFRGTFSEAGSYTHNENMIVVVPDIAMNPATEGTAQFRAAGWSESELEVEIAKHRFRFERVD